MEMWEKPKARHLETPGAWMRAEGRQEAPAVGKQPADAGKAALRKRMKELWRQAAEEENARADQRLLERLRALPELAGAACIYAYVPLKTEAGDFEILKWALASGKRLALPRVEGAHMDFYLVGSLEDLEKGAFGLWEPKKACPPAKEKQAAMLVPGTAFTKLGSRLGKGGGFYDRFLSKEPGHLAIGLAYDFQVLETLPVQAHDRTMELIVTPSAVYRCFGTGTT